MDGERITRATVTGDTRSGDDGGAGDGPAGVLVARTVHPEYTQVLRTYARNQGMPVEDFGYDARTGLLDLEDLERKITDSTAAALFRIAEFFGVVENVKTRQRSRTKGALLVFMFA